MRIVYYSIGFMKSTSKFWRQITKVGWGLLIRRKIITVQYFLVYFVTENTSFNKIFYVHIFIFSSR